MVLAADLGPEAFEDLTHRLDIADVRYVGEPARAGSHERRGHELERGVLGALDLDLA